MNRIVDPMHGALRTTTFRLDPESCGHVWLWRPGHKARAVWQTAIRLWADKLGRKPEDVRLPHRSLSIALTVLCRDFVHAEPRVQHSEDVLFVSRTRMSDDVMVNALLAWEQETLRFRCGLDELVSDLQQEQVALWDVWPQTADAPPPPDWWFRAAKWEVAHRLCVAPLRADKRDIVLRPDSEGALLTWEDLIFGKPKVRSRGPNEGAEYGTNGRSGHNAEPEQPDRAMHRLLLNPLWVPGWREPFISIVPTVSRLSNRLGKWVRNVWMDIGAGYPVLRGEIYWHKGLQGWAADWRNTAGRILNEAAAADLSQLNDQALCAGTHLRATPRVPLPGYTIGKGPGQIFFDAVAHHARARLPGLEPLVLKRAIDVKNRSRPVPGEDGLALAIAEAGKPIRIVCLYAHSFTRRRMAVGLARLLESDGKKRMELVRALEALADGDEAYEGREDSETLFRHSSGLELTFRRPYRADMLCRFDEDEAIRRRADEWLRRDLSTGRLLLCLIETLSDKDLREAEKEVWRRRNSGGVPVRDPKPVLRQHLAARGVITQFMAEWILRDPTAQYPAEAMLRMAEKDEPSTEISASTDEPEAVTGMDGAYYAGNASLSTVESSSATASIDQLGVPAPQPALRKGRRRLTRDEREQKELALAANQATLDLLRGGGIFPWKIEGTRIGVPEGTWLVGITGVHRWKRDRHPNALADGWALTLVATQVGARSARAWVSRKGWRPFDEANASFLQDLQLLNEEGAREELEKAIRIFLAENGGPVVLFIDGQACRRLWEGLQEQHRDESLPEVVQNPRVAVVRCRSARRELPSLAGRNGWRTPDSLQFSNSIGLLLASEQSDACRTWYYAEASRTQRQDGEHREWTRFGLADPEDQRNDWHAFTTREFQVVYPGPFEPLQLARLAAHQCRCAPTWVDGTLARPAQLHLAWKMLQDHPLEPLSEEQPEEEEEG